MHKDDTIIIIRLLFYLLAGALFGLSESSLEWQHIRTQGVWWLAGALLPNLKHDVFLGHVKQAIVLVAPAVMNTCQGGLNIPFNQSVLVGTSTAVGREVWLNAVNDRWDLQCQNTQPWFEKSVSELFYHYLPVRQHQWLNVLGSSSMVPGFATCIPPVLPVSLVWFDPTHTTESSRPAVWLPFSRRPSCHHLWYLGDFFSSSSLAQW